MPSKEEIIEFLRNIHPFTQLSIYQVSEIAKSATIQHYRKNDKFSLDSNYIFIVHSGLIKVGTDHYSSRDIINPHKLHDKNAEVVEDCKIIKIPTDKIGEYFNIKEFPTYFIESKKYDIEKIDFETPIKHLIRRRPIVIYEDSKIHDAAKIMLEHGISSVVVVDKYGRPIGILTDSDLRRVVAQGIDIQRSVTDIMSKNLVTASREESILSTLMKMIKYRIKHIVVQTHQEIDGVVTIRDLIEVISGIPIYIIRDVARARNVNELLNMLNHYQSKLARLVITNKSINTLQLSKIVSSINDTFITKLIEYYLEDKEVNVRDFCFLVSGSCGRMEQVLITDHDYLIITINKDLKELEKYVKEELMRSFTLSKSSLEHVILVTLENLNALLEKANLLARVILSLIADSRIIYGNLEIYKEVKKRVENYMLNNKIVHRLLIEDALKYKPSLDVLDRLTGSEIDIKHQGTLPISLGIQGLALAYNVEQTNTIARIEELEKLGVISSDLKSDLEIAYTFIHYLKAKIEASKFLRNEEVNTKVDLDLLTELELRYLKDSFRTIKKFRKFLEKEISKFIVL